ncbi:hypothetical protein QMK33_19095 [Hymenobacter sp. H14-R3]|uniref:DUF6985 domain-containing protein n=1 Tax=Hymenobacter sp. H14-R3 TaxID=3046308 RepID=UPI0024B9D1FE|nr:hypothetical protein [Hymenobacter sp. H14-R3]MDJ0367260.1 hypothetical protein [Hymenobacter sp. H14-R3]
MLNHSFWGDVAEDWAGLSAEHPVTLPGFERPIEVFLGEELFEEDEEYNPTPAQLDAYSATFQRFMAHAPELIAELQEQAFAQYQQLYAHYYDDPAQSGEPALGLTSAAQHAVYMQDISYLRVSDEDTLRLVIAYDLDPEHGLEARFVANKLVEIGGIADT